MTLRSHHVHFIGRLATLASIVTIGGGLVVLADRDDVHFRPDNLVVSRSVYDNNTNVQGPPVSTPLPPNCTLTLAPNFPPDACVTAVADGTYPFVFNNAPVDSSFGVTSKIFLDQLTPWGLFIDTLAVPDDAGDRGGREGDHLVTSFSSKSELALNLSTSGRFLTFMGYVTTINQLDVSNSNTPLPFTTDATNPVGESVYRAAAQVDDHGRFQFTETNAYSGNNGRAAILVDTHGVRQFYTAGNAGNGNLDPQPDGIIVGAGAQILDPSHQPEADQNPGVPTPVGSFWVSELGANPVTLKDKVGKDDNFRGLTLHHNVLYFTKGSGSNGVNTVFFIDTTGRACPSTSATPGIGVPEAGAALPTTPIVYDLANLPTEGLPNNMCVLAGFPATPNKTKNFTSTNFPFGMFFADDNTLYVADEGSGTTGKTVPGFYTPATAAEQEFAGLEKWIFDAATQKWTLAYTIQAGLDLGVPYVVPNYPTGNNPGTGFPWAPATDGLRNITGRVDRDGRVTIWAITSTISGGGDQGADPNRLVAVTDQLSATTLPTGESFKTLRTAKFGEVLRGVSFTPGSGDRDRDKDKDHERKR
jgi:hypothetical protein